MGGRVWGVQGGCEWRSEAFVKIQKNKKKFWGGGVGGGWVGGWVRGRGVGFGGDRVDGNGELKLL